MSEPERLQAVIFDLDGVLVSTSRLHAQAWRELAERHGVQPPDDLEERVKGISRMASLRIALGERWDSFSPAERDAMADWKNKRYLALCENLSPRDLFPGAAALLEDLRRAGIRPCLGSASKNARPILERLGIAKAFDVIADGFTYRLGKPNPDVFLTAARMASAPPEACLVVEDAAAGITAALDGGFVAVGMGAYESLKHAHAFITSLNATSAAALQEIHQHFHPRLWTVQKEGRAPSPAHEASLGTLFCTGNGRLGLRGHLCEGALGGDPGIFVSGFFDRFERPALRPEMWPPFMRYWGVAELAAESQIEVNLINAPDFLDTGWAVEGEPVNFATGELKSLTRRLDLRTGLFTFEAQWVSPRGKEVRLVMRRFADRIHTDRAYAQYELEAVNFSGRLEVRANLNLGVANQSELGPQRLFDVTDAAALGDRAVAMRIRGVRDGAGAVLATGLAIPDRTDVRYDAHVAHNLACVHTVLAIEQGRPVYVERYGVAVTERRTLVRAPVAHASDAMSTAAAQMQEAQRTGFTAARIASAAAWQALWSASDVRIDGHLDDQLGTRYSIYHLLIAADANDDGVSIGAKSLSGEYYRGMVFWDTDVHMTPFFTFTQPAMARNLARFRWRTLSGARAKAARYGFRGAFYPWETGISGEEETEKWLKLITHQVHLTADVAWAIQNYVNVTGDIEFYEDGAAEVLIEIARFWLSKAVSDGDLLSLPDAGGPDEFHVVSHDSAFVNNLAAYNLRMADRAVRHLQQAAPAKLADLQRRLKLTDAELATFAPAAERLKTMQQPSGLFEQCRGFFALKDEVVRDAVAPQEYQTVKQADVLMLFYMRPDAWSPEVLRTNYDYYEPRTVHGSSLSHAVHGILAAELGRLDKADEYIQRSLGMDLKDERGNLADGAHMAANGMNWMAIVRGYGGCRPGLRRDAPLRQSESAASAATAAQAGASTGSQQQGCPWHTAGGAEDGEFLVEPRLPARWRRLKFRLQWRGADFTVEVTPTRTIVANSASAKEPLPLRLRGRSFLVAPGQTVESGSGNA